MLASTAYRHGLDALKNYSDDPEGDMRQLLLAALGESSQTLTPYLTRILSDESSQTLDSYITERKTQKPIAYIVGYADFGEHRYQVEPGVLIPRPDTETLVESAAGWLEKNGSLNPLILELGLGTGIVSLELANRFPECYFYGWEIDLAAYQVACNNQRQISPKNTRFYHQDFFAKDAAWRDLLDTNRPMLLLSNPPYISQDDLKALDPSVHDFEPHLALDGGKDGLDIYRQLFNTFSNCPQTTLWVEMGYDQKASLQSLGASLGWQLTHSQSDMGDRDRALCFTTDCETKPWRPVIYCRS